MSKFSFLNRQKEYIFPPEKEELKNLLETTILMPRPNDDFECVIPLFNAREHYKHLKKMMWKFKK